MSKKHLITDTFHNCINCEKPFYPRVSASAVGQSIFCNIACCRIYKSRPIEDRFWNFVHKTDTCWLWIGTKQNHCGYGRIGNKPRTYAHRLSWEIHNGKIPEGFCVLHTCDVRSCVNPAHLYLGKDAENARDRVNRNRQVRGSKHGLSKLVEADIPIIRKLTEDGLKRKDIGIIFSVDQHTISDVIYKKRWKHIP